jgi:ComF family protein
MYPTICPGCGDLMSTSKEIICFSCEVKLPVNTHLFERQNALEKIFWGRIPLVRGISYLEFTKKGMTQRLLHQIKYNGNKDVGFYLGQKFGRKILEHQSLEQVDLIIPMPLHKKRLLHRGYNQSEIIAQGLAESIHKAVVADSVSRIVNTVSQTKKSRTDRWKNVEGIFRIEKPELLSNKHLLLIDDTITTGATLEALGRSILSKVECKLSVAAIACTQAI